MSCTAHKTYKGVYKPRTNCHTCWALYYAKKKPKLTVVPDYRCDYCSAGGSGPEVCPSCGEDRLR